MEGRLSGATGGVCVGNGCRRSAKLMGSVEVAAEVLNLQRGCAGVTGRVERWGVLETGHDRECLQR